MRINPLLLRLLLLPLVAPVWAQPAPVVAEPQPTRPLNLTLPREVALSTPPAFLAPTGDDAATRNVRSSAVDGRGHHAASMPYGTGYEARQRAQSAAGGFARGDGSHGSRGGRGGMGHGR